ncbi:MAG: hypothetical protein ABEJ31_11675 [Haloarculaceae archaeon]
MSRDDPDRSADADAPADGDSGTDGAAGDGDWGADPATDDGGRADAFEPSGDGPGDDPFGSFESAGEAAGAGDPWDAFESVEVDDVDPDRVWDELTRGAEADAADGDRSVADVSKHSYCERCEHFSRPPEARCTHDGTEIVEFLDMDTVRVVECPVVARQHELEGDVADFHTE